MKAFKATGDILLKNNNKLNLIDQCPQCKIKQDIEQIITEIKKTLPNVNDQAPELPEVLKPSKQETLLKMIS